MRRPLIALPRLITAALLLAGCSTTSVKKEAEAAPPKPEMTISVASLNLTNLNKRIEKADISKLWQALKKEHVEVLAVQNVSRYPGLGTRVDLVNELSTMADWRTAWGEMADNSGRVMGNAVLSSYPVRSSAHVPFTGVKSVVFEGGLHAVIDGGVREILIVSATLPPKGTSAELKKCQDQILNARGDGRSPVIITGNLPQAAGSLKDVDNVSTLPTRIQFDGAGVMKAGATTRIETPLGTVIISTFELYRTPF